MKEKRRTDRAWGAGLAAIGGLLVMMLGTACEPAVLAQAGTPPTAAETARADVTATLGIGSATAAATAEAAHTKVPQAATATPVIAAMEGEEWSQSSPDGQWVASGLAALPTGAGLEYYTRLVVERVGGGTTWVPVDHWGPTGLGFTIPAPLAWSRDGQTFYFTNRPHPDGCALLVNGSDLLALDLITGQVQALLPDVGLSLALSPDETKAAYVSYGDRGLVVHDLTTGNERAISLDLGAAPRAVSSAQAGLPVWAPDGGLVALTIAHNPCGDPERRSHSIVIVNLADGAATTLVEHDARQLVTTEWPAADRLRVTDADGMVWTVNPETGELTR